MEIYIDNGTYWHGTCAEIRVQLGPNKLTLYVRQYLEVPFGRLEAMELGCQIVWPYVDLLLNASCL